MQKKDAWNFIIHPRKLTRGYKVPYRSHTWHLLYGTVPYWTSYGTFSFFSRDSRALFNNPFFLSFQCSPPLSFCALGTLAPAMSAITCWGKKTYAVRITERPGHRARTAFRFEWSVISSCASVTWDEVRGFLGIRVVSGHCPGSQCKLFFWLSTQFLCIGKIKMRQKYL